MKSVALWIAAIASLIGACSSGPAPSRSAISGSSPAQPAASLISGASLSASPVAATWADDLSLVDRSVRIYHVSPFTIHPESQWIARLADVSSRIDAATPNQQIALVSSLVGLLDTHSAFVDIPGGWHFYGLLPYRFSDGWFVIRAADSSLVGDRLVSIGGVKIDDAVDRLTPLVPHDNADGLLEGLVWELNSVEYLNGSGIVSDVARPAFGLQKPDGTSVTVNPPSLDGSQYDLVNPGWLTGAGPEAVARRGERIWTRVDTARRVFLISVNDYGDMVDAGTAMTAALDAKQVDRVVLDMRYLQGGNGDIAILGTLRDDPRINRTGGLIVLIGRENVSAATSAVEDLDRNTKAILVGEPTPARADNFRCDCHDFVLPHSGFTLSVPTYWDRLGDDRPEIAPDVPILLSSKDFFAGRDPVLDAALAGTVIPK